MSCFLKNLQDSLPDIKVVKLRNEGVEALVDRGILPSGSQEIKNIKGDK